MALVCAILLVTGSPDTWPGPRPDRPVGKADNDTAPCTEDPSSEVLDGEVEEVVAVMTLIGIAVAGLVVLAVVAVVIGTVDAARAGTLRQVAAQRRVTWERRQQMQGQRRHVDAWADEDDD